MSSEFTAEEQAYLTLRARTLWLYSVISGLMLAGIAILALYAFKLGPILGPGVTASFGYAVALMFLMGAVLIHIVDRIYRVYPFGRRIHPARPSPLGAAEVATFLRVVVVIAAIGAVGYILGSLIAT